MSRPAVFLRSSYRQTLFLLAAVPLVMAATAIAALVAVQARELADQEIRQLESQLIAAKKRELRNYVTQARNGFFYIYGSASDEDDAAKRQVRHILSAMIYGEQGFFFAYDKNGTALVSPRQTEFIGRNRWDYRDGNGKAVVQEFIATARSGSGFVEHLWPKPSTGEEAEMITYVTSLPTWRWTMGTGVFIDDVTDTVAATRAEVETRMRRTFLWIGAITLTALLLVFVSGLLLNVRERRLADRKLRELTQRVFDAQEEERGRVARELHDGISQMLVGVRYALDITQRRLASGDARAGETLARGADHLGEAIGEVRRISRDLRPGVLDDLGLGPAIKALADDFRTRSGIETRFETVVFRNRLDGEARIALYRIAQEALTNVERHSGAGRVTIDLRGHRAGATLRITDDGRGIDAVSRSAQTGLGLRNMQERMDQLGGSLRILSSRVGTVIEARVPLSHMLPPQETTPQGTRAQA